MVRRTSVASLIAFLMTATVVAAPPAGRAAPTAARAEALLPLELQVRERFPSVVLDSQATLEPAQELVAGRMVSGMRARPIRNNPSAHPPLQPLALSLPSDGDAASDGGLRVFYPASYNEAFVVEVGEQRVALRAVGAHFAQAAAAAGKLFYTSPHDSVDVIEVPSTGRSEELLVLHDARAPRVFEYEIVEMRGVAGLMMQDGAIRFALDHVAVPALSQIASGRFTAPQACVQIDRPWVIDANGRRSETAAQWTILETQQDQPRRIRLTIDSDPLVYPLVVDPSFSATGSMTAARANHTATLLPNGKVLVAGGYNGAYLTSAELYDPATGTFTATGSLRRARREHTATLLPNGKVLIAGGYAGSFGGLASAELYDPASGTFTATGSLTISRYGHTATLLPNGSVLIAGGTGAGGFGEVYLSSAELYDPASGTFSATGSMATARGSHTTTLLPLPNGKVLIVGGSNGSYLTSAELYDPASGTFTATGSLASARYGHTATLLPSGKVLIASGSNGIAYLASAELYDPASGTFSATGSLDTPRASHAATLLPSGKVLIAGGWFNSSYPTPSELYDPVSGMFSAAGSLGTARRAHTATLLPNGTVLIAGGRNASYLTSAELYDAASGTFSASGSLVTGRAGHTATLLPNGKVLITGGCVCSQGCGCAGPFIPEPPPPAELYDPASGTFSATGTLAYARALHTATLLPNGKVLIVGGCDGGCDDLYYAPSAELYDPATGSFSPRPSLSGYCCNSHTATLLPNGKVLIAGGQYIGQYASGYSTGAELYDAASDMFSSGGSLTMERFAHTATLLPNGKVLITGGWSSLTPAELYDPANGTSSATGSLGTGRSQHTATLLPNGKVLIAGGFNGSYLTSAELYDPASGTFSATGSLGTVRDYHTATLLPNGKVLIAGGRTTGNAYLTSAEMYDPASGTFSNTASLGTARENHTATLLPSGKVLVAGGYNGALMTSAELYDAGLGYSDLRRPVVSAPSTLVQPAAITLSGSGFRGDSEASGGSTNSSPTNYPLLQLQRMDNDQTLFLSAGSAWSDTSFISTSLSGLANGPYRLTVVTNAIPSLPSLVYITTSAPTITNVNPSIGPASGGQSVTITGTNLDLTSVTIGFNAGTVTGTTTTTATFVTPPHAAGVVDVSVAAAGGSVTSTGAYTYGATPTLTNISPNIGPASGGQTVTITGTNLSNATAVTFGGSSSAVATNTATSITVTTPSGAAGAVDVVVTTVGGSATSVGGYTYFAFDAPSSFSATATSTSQVFLAWSAVSNPPGFLVFYEVYRSSSVSGPYSLALNSFGTSANDSGLSANTTYLYKVRVSYSGYPSGFTAIDPATTIVFTDPSLSGVMIKAAHIGELRTAVNAMRAAAGLPPSTFTDPTLTAGSTSNFTMLRGQVNTGTYSSIIKAVHLTELRTALDAALSALGLAPINYTDPTITAQSTVMKAAHLTELRARTQ